jgi:hypothetical protein
VLFAFLFCPISDHCRFSNVAFWLLLSGQKASRGCESLLPKAAGVPLSGLISAPPTPAWPAWCAHLRRVASTVVSAGGQEESCERPRFFGFHLFTLHDGIAAGELIPGLARHSLQLLI